MAKKSNSSNDRLVYSEFNSDFEQPNDHESDAIDLPPQQQKITVQASRKGRGGKTVTVATGFQHTPDTLKALLKHIKTKCGSGGTVKEETLEIQGDKAQAVAEALTQKGYKVKISGQR